MIEPARKVAPAGAVGNPVPAVLYAVTGAVAATSAFWLVGRAGRAPRSGPRVREMGWSLVPQRKGRIGGRNVRVDGAWLGSVNISINKAFTARAFDVATKDLAENAQPGEQFYGIDSSNEGRVMIFASGIPLENGGES